MPAQNTWDTGTWDSGFWDSSAAQEIIRKKMKIAVALNLFGLKPEEKVAKLQTAITKCTGNATVPTPDPTVVDCQAAHDAADVGIKAVDAEEETLKTLRMHRDQLVDAAMLKYSALGSFVEVKAIKANDPSIVTGAGFDLAGAVTPTPNVVSRVTNLALTHGDFDGSVDASWDRDKKAKSYKVQMSIDPLTDASWKEVDTTSKSSYTLKNLTSGQKIWVRVCAVGSNGSGPWSDPATIVVP
jgi:hypothetical protein